MATFNDSLRPRCGIVVQRRIGPTSSVQSFGRPAASLPITRAIRPVRSVAVCGVTVRPAESWLVVPIVVSPEPSTSSIVAVTTGTRNSAPADDRTTFGLKGSTLPGVNTTRSAPAASADRSTVPRFPGSLTRSSTTTKSAAASRSAGVPSGAHEHDRDRVLRCLGARNPFEHAWGQLEHRTAALYTWLHDPVGFVSDELCLALPAGGDRLGDEHRTLDDETTLVVTRTAAPDQAPQLLYSWIVERQCTHRGPV